MEYREVEISKIKESKYNPSIRTDRTNKKYISLKRNIEENGLLSPVLIARNGVNLVAGHRRLNVFKDLGYKYIPAIINHKVTNNNYDKMFVADHKDAMLLTPAQETERYLEGAPVISKETLAQIKKLENIGGTPCIKRIVSDHMSPNTFLIGINMYTSYIRDHSMKAKRQALYWMFNVGTGYQLKTAIKAFVDAEMIRKAVEGRTEFVGVDWLKTRKKRSR
tara:strand:- start:63 stop:725 length:663 start_codon:yes stop_codon:yes gene_type:complete